MCKTSGSHAGITSYFLASVSNTANHIMRSFKAALSAQRRADCWVIELGVWSSFSRSKCSLKGRVSANINMQHVSFLIETKSLDTIETPDVIMFVYFEKIHTNNICSYKCIQYVIVFWSTHRWWVHNDSKRRNVKGK